MRSDSRVLRAWGAVLLWTALVWSMGSDGFGANQTSRILGPLLEWLLPDASEERLSELLFLLRKTAHVVEYGLLALLILRAAWLAAPLSSGAAVAVALALVASLAIADELRQAGSAARTGSAWDVLLDVGGAVLALLLVFALPDRLRSPLFPRAGDSRTS